MGVAGHGGLSPYDVHTALLTGGPSFKKAFTSDLPTSNVDIVPTILAIHKINIPATMDGRVLTEFLAEGKGNNMQPKKETITTSVGIADGQYTLTLQRTVLGKYRYVDFAKVVRVVK
jgi:arylsulfatase A-like enzyme